LKLVRKVSTDLRYVAAVLPIKIVLQSKKDPRKKAPRKKDPRKKDPRKSDHIIANKYDYILGGDVSTYSLENTKSGA